VFHETDHTVFGILVKFPWHVPDFPIYSNGTKPGTLQHSWCGQISPDVFEAQSITLTKAA
ncbi:hypothetical protein, partial [Corynebacterium belfantii]|uniref:hypothetical protein n=1 Tax=Corynebacterium belfantii TaxID=2014537 RepID=UPI001A7E9057